MFTVLIVMGLAVAVAALVILGAITLSIGLFEAATTRRASP